MNFYIVKMLRTTNEWYYNKVNINKRVYDKTHPPLCPYCGRQLRRYVLTPLEFDMDIAMPYFGDMVYDVEFIIVSERFKNLFEMSGLKGIENFREMTLKKIRTYNGVRKAKLPEPPRYFMADIVVDGAAIDLKKSKAIFHRPEFCHYCMLPTHSHYKDGGNLGLVKYNGCFVDRSRWNRNNIFVLLGEPCRFAVDQKFKDWFELNHLQPGCLFTPENEATMDYTTESMTNTYSFE